MLQLPTGNILKSFDFETKAQACQRSVGGQGQQADLGERYFVCDTLTRLAKSSFSRSWLLTALPDRV